jgi:hypothetical protein
MAWNPLIRRIIGGFTNSAQDELLEMIDEFRVDYQYDDSFVYALNLIEENVLEEEYNKAWRLLQEMAPMNISPLDLELFEEILMEAEYS